MKNLKEKYMSLFFETIKVQNGVIYNLKNHNKRLNETIFKNFKIKSDINLEKYISPPNDKVLYRCKVVYSKQIESINFYPYRFKNIKSFKIITSNIKYNFKYFNRDNINKLLSNRYDDILIVDTLGYIRDISIANIAIKKENIWLTPENPMLKGTMREKLLNEKKIYTKKLKIDEIVSMNGFAIMNAMIGFKEIKNPEFSY